MAASRPEWWERFEKKFSVDENGCWVWNAYINNGGYGTFGIKHSDKWRIWLAHRAAYVTLVGPIPAGLELDHLCRVRRCVNPEHLEPVTRRENVHRGDRVWRSGLCHAGLHDIGNPENVRHNRSGYRTCKPCDKQRKAEYYRRLQGK